MQIMQIKQNVPPYYARGKAGGLKQKNIRRTERCIGVYVVYTLVYTYKTIAVGSLVYRCIPLLPSLKRNQLSHTRIRRHVFRLQSKKAII